MTRRRLAFIVVIVVLAWATREIRADVRAQEKGRVEFAGVLGKVVNIFGGKAAREGITTTIAVKGDRKASLSDTTGQIVDLGEEKVYDLDVRKHSYTVTTFAELRRRMEEARRKAEEDAKKQEASEAKSGKAEPAPSKPADERQVDIDFDVKNTGQTKSINGFDTHEAIMTITVREKGKTLEESGGLVLTSDMWLGPPMPEMKEIAEFDRRYYEKLYGPMIEGASAEQMASALALYPMLKPAMGRMSNEAGKLQGAPVQTTTTMDAVKSAEQMAEEKKQQESEAKPDASGGVGGLVGGFAKRMAQKKASGGGEPKARATFMTVTSEVLKVTTDVSPTDVAVPAGFKEAK